MTATPSSPLVVFIYISFRFRLTLASDTGDSFSSITCTVKMLSVPIDTLSKWFAIKVLGVSVHKIVEASPIKLFHAAK